MSVVVLLDVGWDETNQDINLHMELVDADGKAVEMQGPLGEQPLAMDAVTQAGRPPGAKPGTESRLPLVLNIGPGLPLQGDQRYEWRASINGKHDAAWTAGFFVQPAPPQ